MTPEDWLRGEFSTIPDLGIESLGAPTPSAGELRERHRRAQKAKRLRDQNRERLRAQRERRRAKEEAQSKNMNRLGAPIFQSIAAAVRRDARSRAELEAELAKAGATSWSIRRALLNAEVNGFIRYDSQGRPRLGELAIRRRILANLRAQDRQLANVDAAKLLEDFVSKSEVLTGRPNRASAA
jgi:hypothetical protein